MYHNQLQPPNNKVRIQNRVCSTSPHSWIKAHKQQRLKNVLSETLLDGGEKTGREYTEDPGQYLNGLQLIQGHHNTQKEFFSAYLIIRKEDRTHE